MTGRLAAWARRHEYLTAAAFLAVVLSVWFSPLFAGEQMGQPGTLYGMYPWAGEPAPSELDKGRFGESDIAVQMQPLTDLARDQVHDGQLPLANPYGAGGMPLFADMQTALAFPPTWLAMVLPTEDAWGWIKFLELLVAGLATYALTRHLRIGRGASLVAAVVYMLSAPMIAWIQYPTGVVAIFLPWLLLTSERLYERPSARRIAALAAVVGLSLLAGHPETVLASSSAAGVFLIVRAAFDRGRPLRDRLWMGGAWLGGHLLGLGISAVAVIPFLAAHSSSISADFRAGNLLSMELPVTSVLTLLMPDIYGDGRPDYFGPNLFYVVVAGYFGVTALLLALVGLVRYRRAPQALGLAAMGAVTLMTIYGIPPVYWFVDHVYPWSQAGLSHTFNVVALAAAVGAGAGVHALVRRPLAIGGAAALVAGGGALTAVAVALAANRDRLPAPSDIEEDALVRFAVVLAATALCVFVLGRVRRPAVAVAVVMAVLLADLGQFRSWNVLEPAERARPAKTAGLEFLERQRRPFRIGLIRPTARDPAVLSPNMPMDYRLDSVEAYDFPAPRRWMDLRWEVLGHRGDSREILIYAPAPAGTALSAQRMLNTRFYLAAPGTPRPQGLRTAYDGRDIRIFEDPKALPRAYVVGRTMPAGYDQTVFALRSGVAKPDRTALVPLGVPAVRSSAAQRAASFEQVAPDRYRVRVPAGAPGWLVVGQSYTPRWKAELDGRSAKLYPTNLALMGLPLDAGEHVVDIRRSRTDVTLGLALTLASIAIALGLVALGRRRKGA